MGGAGKTPVALSLAELFPKKNVHFLTRGYKGSLKGPTHVNPKIHTAHEVGDEPLLLAGMAPTWVSKQRFQGAEAAIEAGAQMIIMDDGFQNRDLQKTFSFVVVDGRFIFG